MGDTDALSVVTAKLCSPKKALLAASDQGQGLGHSCLVCSVPAHAEPEVSDEHL